MEEELDTHRNNLREGIDFGKFYLLSYLIIFSLFGFYVAVLPSIRILYIFVLVVIALTVPEYSFVYFSFLLPRVGSGAL